MLVVSVVCVHTGQQGWSGQSWAMWPCFEHSKHWPSFWCFSLSASVIAFHTTADVSMAFESSVAMARTFGSNISLLETQIA
jgi:hypothetical protein